MCEACGARPQAYHGRRFCYDCKPGSKGRPLPCRKCGSKKDYWAERLCSRCHQYAPQRPGSCRDCDAWGVTRTTKWLCGGCTAWRQVNHTSGACAGCGLERHLNRHLACRLCWRQTKLLRQPGQPLDVEGANRDGQQLFFANMHATNYLHRQAHVPTESTSEVAPKPRSRAKPHHQLTLRPVPILGVARKFGFADPPDRELAGRLDCLVVDHARGHGWSDGVIRKARVGMRVLLAMRDTDRVPVLATDVERLVPFGLPARSVRAVLDEAGLLDDDRTPALERWFDRQLVGLPATMAGEIRVWFDMLRNGSTSAPRRKPRSPGTIKTNLNWALPTLRAWAEDGHQSLREITRDDVLVALPARGTPRATVGHGLRSIFTTLKSRKVIFANPTARVDFGTFERRIPMPADLDALREILCSGDPSRAALGALAAFHGLRPAELRDLKLTDVHDGRAHLADRTVPLAPAVNERLASYLAYRHERWPSTANPHFFIHYLNAPTTAAVSRIWVNRRLGISAQAIRRDRMVDEAVATGGDVRQISDFFGVTVATATHYAEVADRHPRLSDGSSS